MSLTDADIEARIQEAFAENLEMLQHELGQAITRDAQEAALQQVLMYWRKMGDIAKKITDTEVRLNLPNQTSPAGRKFGIEGVVDIVREDNHTAMYDIKSHEVEYVRANEELYQEQLNIYAYIWQHLHGQDLDYTAVIATSFPEDVRQALVAQNERQITHALDLWNPLVVLPFQTEQVEATIAKFGTVVDQIEEGEFAPPPPETLQQQLPGSNTLFARRVCRQCDLRFSCHSYREYAIQSNRGTIEQRVARYFTDYGSDLDTYLRQTAALDSLEDEA